MRRWLHKQPNSDNREPQFSGPCPRLLLRAVSCDRAWFFIPCSTLAGTVRRYVGVTSLRLFHAPTHEAFAEQAKHFSAVRVWKDAGQRACTVPTERYQHGYSHKLYISILSQRSESGNAPVPKPHNR